MKRLLWIMERMVDTRVADVSVKLWSEQAALAADLQKLLKDADMRRNMVLAPDAYKTYIAYKYL